MAIETVKAIVEMPLPFGGKVVQIHGKVGDVIPVGEPLVTLLTDEMPQTEGAQINHLVGQRRNAASAPKEGNSGLTRRLPPKERAPRIAATPAVRRLAREMGVDLATVTGTGRGGTITADDVRAASEAAK
jgi:pyruvate/2-oxoglutarate dehydrogenase complex dihydrolipoamide acyltransferase (E2) component